MKRSRNPLVLIPQHFGCLLFDRRTSRYLPFDREAADLLVALHRRPIDTLLAGLSEADREAVLGFFDCFYDQGYFTLDGMLAGDVLAVDVPADHLVGPPLGAPAPSCGSSSNVPIPSPLAARPGAASFCRQATRSPR